MVLSTGYKHHWETGPFWTAQITGTGYLNKDTWSDFLGVAVSDTIEPKTETFLQTPTWILKINADSY
jgi:hypothetical protein